METPAFNLMSYPARAGSSVRDVTTFRQTTTGSARVIGRVVAPDGSKLRNLDRGRIVLQVPTRPGEFIGLSADEALAAARKGEYGLRYEDVPGA